jgi:hypothetical protein
MPAFTFVPVPAPLEDEQLAVFGGCQAEATRVALNAYGSEKGDLGVIYRMYDLKS